MSLKVQNEIFMMNPITKRSIVKGGRVYKKLIKDGYIDSKTNKTIKEIHPLINETLYDEKENEKENKDIKRSDNIQLDENLLPESKLEELVEDLNKQKIDGEKLSELVAKASENVMNKHKDKLAEINDEEELYDEIKNLINEELKSLLYI